MITSFIHTLFFGSTIAFADSLYVLQRTELDNDLINTSLENNVNEVLRSVFPSQTIDLMTEESATLALEQQKLNPDMSSYSPSQLGHYIDTDYVLDVYTYQDKKYVTEYKLYKVSSRELVASAEYKHRKVDKFAFKRIATMQTLLDSTVDTSSREHSEVIPHWVLYPPDAPNTISTSSVASTKAQALVGAAGSIPCQIKLITKTDTQKYKQSLFDPKTIDTMVEEALCEMTFGQVLDVKALIKVSEDSEQYRDTTTIRLTVENVINHQYHIEDSEYKRSQEPIVYSMYECNVLGNNADCTTDYMITLLNDANLHIVNHAYVSGNHYVMVEYRPEE